MARIKVGATFSRWVPRWDQTNQLDGHTAYLELWDCGQLAVFRTRKACLEHIREAWGYVAKRSDLRKEPHCWRVPQAVKVTVTVVEK